MRGLKLAGAMVAALLAVACTNHQINFDQLPDGSAAPSWDGSPLYAGHSAVITTQYAPDGVASFTSPGGGVALLAGQNPTSPPNVACPFGSGVGTGFGGTTTITLAQETDNIWVTIPNGWEATVSAFDFQGNLLESHLSSVQLSPTEPEVTAPQTGVRRVNITYSGIKRVELSGNLYCFDDFAWREHW